MSTKAIASEARVEAAAAEIAISSAQAAASGAGFKGSAQQIAGTACPASATTAISVPFSATLLGAGRPVKIDAYTSGTGAAAAVGAVLNIETAAVVGGPYTPIASTELSGIPTGGAGLAAAETLAGSCQFAGTLPAGATFLRMSITAASVSGAGTVYTTGTAPQGVLSCVQY